MVDAWAEPAPDAVALTCTWRFAEAPSDATPWLSVVFAPHAERPSEESTTPSTISDFLMDTPCPWAAW